MSVILSNEQIKAFDNVMAWHKSDQQEYVLAGYAGTGKTTLAKYIAEEFEKVIFCAYTGKAAQVLKEKGCANAGTIHRYLYVLQGEENKEPVFGLNENSPLKYCDLVIVDEYSFLNAEIIGDLRSVARKILYLGDPFQLPPISGQSIISPDFFLEEVHRQGWDNPIIRHATNVRLGKSLSHCDDGKFKYLKSGSLPFSEFMKADQFICGTNATRAKFNARARNSLGYKSELPVKGDKIIFLKNNPVNNIFNGIIGTVSRDAEIQNSYTYKFETSETDGPVSAMIDNDMHDFRMHKSINMVDFAYAITCHKSQGSEFNSVILYNEPVGKSLSDRRKWIYTGITRAKDNIIFIDKMY